MLKKCTTQHYFHGYPPWHSPQDKPLLSSNIRETWHFVGLSEPAEFYWKEERGMEPGLLVGSSDHIDECGVRSECLTHHQGYYLESAH